MARKSKPWWREERGQWFVQHNGRQVPLGPDKVEAEKKWHTLMALAGKDTAGDENPFKIIADERLEWVRRHKKAKTYRVYKLLLQEFHNLHGNVPVKSLKPRHVDEVLALHPDWSKSTIRSFMVCINTTLNWAVRQEYITFNPLAKKLPIPAVVSRGKESVIEPDDYEKMIQHATPALRDFIVACRNTGTRPHVVAAVTAADFYEDAACWVVNEHKTDDDGQPLVVHLNDTMMALTKKLIALHPSGPLFRNNRGNPWVDTAWGKAMAGLRKTLAGRGIKIKGRGILYGFRHTYATDLLGEGVPDTHAATLLGHKSTAMIHKHYSHLGTKVQALKAHLRHIGKVNGEVSPSDAEASLAPAAANETAGGAVEGSVT
jgi:integrase